MSERLRVRQEFMARLQAERQRRAAMQKADRSQMPVGLRGRDPYTRSHQPLPRFQGGHVFSGAEELTKRFGEHYAGKFRNWATGGKNPMRPGDPVLAAIAGGGPPGGTYDVPPEGFYGEPGEQAEEGEKDRKWQMVPLTMPGKRPPPPPPVQRIPVPSQPWGGINLKPEGLRKPRDVDVTKKVSRDFKGILDTNLKKQYDMLYGPMPEDIPGKGFSSRDPASIAKYMSDAVKKAKARAQARRGPYAPLPPTGPPKQWIEFIKNNPDIAEGPLRNPGPKAGMLWTKFDAEMGPKYWPGGDPGEIIPWKKNVNPYGYPFDQYTTTWKDALRKWGEKIAARSPEEIRAARRAEDNKLLEKLRKVPKESKKTTPKSKKTTPKSSKMRKIAGKVGGAIKGEIGKGVKEIAGDFKHVGKVGPGALQLLFLSQMGKSRGPNPYRGQRESAQKYGQPF